MIKQLLKALLTALQIRHPAHIIYLEGGWLHVRGTEALQFNARNYLQFRIAHHDHKPDVAAKELLHLISDQILEAPHIEAQGSDEYVLHVGEALTQIEAEAVFTAQFGRLHQLRGLS